MNMKERVMTKKSHQMFGEEESAKVHLRENHGYAYAQFSYLCVIFVYQC